MIWEKLAKEFLVTGTVGDLICIAFGGFVIGVFFTITVFLIWKLKQQLKEKKKVGDKTKTLMLISMLALTIGGCASMQTEIIAEPGRIDSITVGHFTTANPVDDELIGSYLRKELAKRGFTVTDHSPYVLTGTIAVHPYYSTVEDAKIVLKKDTDQIVWSFQGYAADVFAKSRKEFARYMAEQIAKQLR